MSYIGTPVLIELKYNIKKVDFGQLNFKFDQTGWSVSDRCDNIEFANVLNVKGIKKFLNTNWGTKKVPKLFTKLRGEIMDLKDLKDEQKQYKELKFKCADNIISTYYKNKGVCYIQIGGYGLYRIEGMPQVIPRMIPLFKPTVHIRCRVKGDDSKTQNVYWSFNGACKIETTLEKSKYDLDKDLTFLFEKTR